MPGLNRQGPDGQGPMTGRQQGMCKRTDELPLRGARAGQGRGIGGRGRGGSFQAPAGQARSSARFAQGNTEELASLKAEYQKTQDMLATLIQKIERIEGAKESPENT